VTAAEPGETVRIGVGISVLHGDPRPGEPCPTGPDVAGRRATRSRGQARATIPGDCLAGRGPAPWCSCAAAPTSFVERRGDAHDPAYCHVASVVLATSVAPAAVSAFTGPVPCGVTPFPERVGRNVAFVGFEPADVAWEAGRSELRASGRPIVRARLLRQDWLSPIAAPATISAGRRSQARRPGAALRRTTRSRGTAAAGCVGSGSTTSPRPEAWAGRFDVTNPDLDEDRSANVRQIRAVISRRLPHVPHNSAARRARVRRTAMIGQLLRIATPGREHATRAVLPLTGDAAERVLWLSASAAWLAKHVVSSLSAGWLGS
jgi:hypothetical protein